MDYIWIKFLLPGLIWIPSLFPKKYYALICTVWIFTPWLIDFFPWKSKDILLLSIIKYLCTTVAVLSTLHWMVARRRWEFPRILIFCHSDYSELLILTGLAKCIHTSLLYTSSLVHWYSQVWSSAVMVMYISTQKLHHVHPLTSNVPINLPSTDTYYGASLKSWTTEVTYMVVSAECTLLNHNGRIFQNTCTCHAYIHDTCSKQLFWQSYSICHLLSCHIKITQFFEKKIHNYCEKKKYAVYVMSAMGNSLVHTITWNFLYVVNGFSFIDLFGLVQVTVWKQLNVMSPGSILHLNPWHLIKAIWVVFAARGRCHRTSNKDEIPVQVLESAMDSHWHRRIDGPD